MVKENVDQVSVGLGNGPTSFEAAGATHSTLDVYASDPRLGLPVDITQDVVNVGLSQPISFEAKISQINLGNLTLIGNGYGKVANGIKKQRFVSSGEDSAKAGDEEGLTGRFQSAYRTQ
ncbi:hypothetical protein Q3G72_030080 [Acer saccharum]|nr:hypothetical protein Q3G72_030080 [Acer saccharum]